MTTINIIFIVNFSVKQDKINKGLIFCGIKRSVSLCQLREEPTIIYQWWRGATPIFVISVISIILLYILFIKIINKRNNTEAVTWIKKYFKALSVWYFLSLDRIIGTKAKRLISKPNQAINHESVEITNIIDRKITKLKIISDGCKKIII